MDTINVNLVIDNGVVVTVIWILFNNLNKSLFNFTWVICSHIPGKLEKNTHPKSKGVITKMIYLKTTGTLISAPEIISAQPFLIPKIQAAIQSYPYADEYRSYPGPNSNTFLAPQTPIVIRGVPQEKCEVHHNWFRRHRTAAEAFRGPDEATVESNLYATDLPGGEKAADCTDERSAA